jgi:hypothetical protein
VPVLKEQALMWADLVSVFWADSQRKNEMISSNFLDGLPGTTFTRMAPLRNGSARRRKKIAKDWR